MEALGNKMQYESKTLAKAMELLLIFMAKEGPSVSMSFTEICQESRMNRGTVYRLLKTFQEYGFIYQNPDTGRYQLGIKILEMGTKVLEGLDLRSAAKPILHQLVEETKETVHIAILDDIYIVYIEKVEHRDSIPLGSSIGGRMPAHSTASGKAILAFSSEKCVNRVIESGLTARTNNTITDPEKFRQALREINLRGWAFDGMENEEGIQCVAAPIFDHMRRVMGAISISWSVTRRDENEISRLGERVKNASYEVSKRMGYRD